MNVVEPRVSTPPFAVPPLSVTVRVTVARAERTRRPACSSSVPARVDRRLPGGVEVLRVVDGGDDRECLAGLVGGAGSEAWSTGRPAGRRPRSRDCGAIAPMVGASLTAVTVIVNVGGAVLSTPPFAVPPSSCAVTVTVAVPFAFAAGV